MRKLDENGLTKYINFAPGKCRSEWENRDCMSVDNLSFYVRNFHNIFPPIQFFSSLAGGSGSDTGEWLF